MEQHRMSVDIRNSIAPLSRGVVCKTAPLGKADICCYMVTAAAIGRVWHLYMCISAVGGAVVKVLRYKSEGRWFDSRWFHWNFSVT